MIKLEQGQTAEEYLLEHKEQRQKFMSDAAIREADMMVEWFREAWMFKDNNGLFDKWDLVDKYWRGDANKPIYPDDIGSETNIVNAHVEGQVALSWQDPVAAYVKAVDPSDTPYKSEAQAILDFIVRENNVRVLRDNIYRRLKKDAIAACSVFWDKKALKGKGIPRIKNWSARYVYFDPIITDPQDFQDSRFVIIAARKSLSWALNEFGEEKAAAITPGYHSVAGQWDFGNTETWDEYETENNSYYHLYIMTKRNSEKVRLIQMSADGVVLREDTLIDDTYPVFFCEQAHVEGHMYGMSSTELLLPLQDQINMLDDAVMTNALLTGMPQKVVTHGSGINMEEWTNEPGLIIKANTLTDAFEVVKPEPVSPDIPRHRNQIMYNDRFSVSRFSDSMIGKAQGGVDTATEAAALQSTGMAIIDSDKRKVQTMFADMLKYAFKLCEEYWTTEMAFRVTGKEAFYHIRPSKLKRIPLVAPASQKYISAATKKAQEDYRESERVAGRMVPQGALPPGWEPPEYEIYKDENGNPICREAVYDIEVDFGADAPSNKAFVLNMLKELYLAKAIDVKELREAAHDMRILPYLGFEDEQKITEDIKAQEAARTKKEEASATATIMNAAANNGIPMQGIPPEMQGMPGGTPMQGNPGAAMPNVTIPGLTANDRVANAATQRQLTLTGG